MMTDVQILPALDTMDPTDSLGSLSQSDAEKVFQVVEEMPRFPGCEEKEEPERSSCATNKLLQYVYGNLRYPTEAKVNKVEGTVIAKFIISEEGGVEKAEITEDIGHGCGEAVLAILTKMNEELRWAPGRSKGEAVNVQFTLPVRFKLGPGNVQKKALQDEEVVSKADEMPRFPGCEERTLDPKELEACAGHELLSYVYAHLEYPEEARVNKVEGLVVVQFVITKDGRLQEPTLAKDIGYGCGQSVLAVMQKIEEEITWIPGRQDGKEVDVKFTLPLRFELEKEKKKKKRGKTRF